VRQRVITIYNAGCGDKSELQVTFVEAVGICSSLGSMLLAGITLVTLTEMLSIQAKAAGEQRRDLISIPGRRRKMG
jgi:hypothetical protein